MKNTLLAGVCAAALTLVAPVASQAQDMSNGWYISMFGGLSVPETMKGRFQTPIIAWDEKDTPKNGFNIGLAVGKSITENLRGEVEFAFARHKQKTAALTATAGSTSLSYAWKGGLNSYTILGNLWYDFNNTSQFTPYLGGGLGLGIVEANMTGPGGFWRRNGTDTAFAFQLGTGVNVALSPTVSLGLGYRFKGIVGFDLKQSSAGGPGTITPFKGLDLYTHNFLANVTFKFNGP